ncbi:MAG: NAD(P)/FAD-dependent oxidoreductase, partial [Zoogloea sp.]|nr:NAD(P)/FAD-dependent oxidoreductase [Zoogloea sp.]
MPPSFSPSRVAVVGGGPAGLMAAETLTRGGVQVDLFDAMPSVGRKFLLAGKGGLNITHAEPLDAFQGRYGSRRDVIAPLLDDFGPTALRAWTEAL